MPHIDFRLKGTRIQIDLLIIPVFLAAMIGKLLVAYSMTLGFIICHELGHIATGAMCGAGLSSFRLLPVGVNAAIDDFQCSKSQKLLIYISGPLVNVVFAIIIYCVHMWKTLAGGFLNVDIMLAITINLWLAIFNLIPIPPLDGGRIAIELLADKVGLFRANRLMNIFSLFFSIMIICIGTVVLIKSRYNGSLVLIGVYIIFLLKKNKKEAAILNMKNFILKRSAIIRKGIFPVREIAVLEDVKVLDLVKSMDYSNVFHIIKVLDNDLHVIKSITEQDILNTLMKGVSDITVGEILTKNI
ncbi:site-2 protease family protein [Clostridium sp. BNL1100]|uniref:site-2 protease family protein n=1 Tax=Clostridium sp. BNL1100 TaxID=755731 RepID=UPI00024A7C63|nr:site-2 protease family protein [Clostridium sp. BNL1100]AEY64926.1 Zn-dependent protease [Clostridium sp. BNL1100]